MAAIPGYLTTAEAAVLIGVDVSQVCRYCQDKKLPAIRVGRSWLIRKTDARAFERPAVGNPNFQQRG